ncbi:UNVERIFIED_CONTAM: Retrovirus-related Pol polyprotein from transposon gypsy [Sesamum radiatum]|uniref:Retrovirus-related Pol polyprotein from transposon gypsy n=1 Tax=Sesamum radiatum TaxID=300843 RepID=A0AAW2KQZ1_SESRA
MENAKGDEIVFGEKDMEEGMGSQNDPMVIRMDIAHFVVHKEAKEWKRTKVMERIELVKEHKEIELDSCGTGEDNKNRGGATSCREMENVHGFYISQQSCLKDPYALPQIDLLVDSTARCALFSMMDANQGYHQIFMAEEDRDKTSFITENGIYCYNVMPFRLKNTGATYQRLVNKMFKDLISKNHGGCREEVYPGREGCSGTGDNSKEASTLLPITQDSGANKSPLETNHAADAFRHLVKWVVELGEFDIEYQSKIAIKAQVLADFVVELTGEMEQQRRGGWMLHVDGPSTSNAGETGVLLQGPEGVEIEVAIKLDFPTTNNEALTIGLEIALKTGVKQFDVYTDSQLVAMHIEGS